MSYSKVFAGSLSNPKFPVRGTKLTGAPRPGPVSSKRESLCRKRQAGRKVGAKNLPIIVPRRWERWKEEMWSETRHQPKSISGTR
ncbi:hypothetical protein DPEC_G00370990 [Dallia pectoralis]|nr:hypothetical protein DPEC_G00370990 [Dallia pectoralis]